MAEYIERVPKCEDCIHTEVCLAQYGTSLKRWVEIDGCKRYKSKADVVEVRHERWKWGYRNGQYGIWCTDCGAGWVDSENAEWIAREHDYCPKCGAKMDGKGEGTDG